MLIDIWLGKEKAEDRDQKRKHEKSKERIAFAAAFLGWIEVSLRFAVCGLWLYTQSLSIILVIVLSYYYLYDLIHMIC